MEINLEVLDGKRLKATLINRSGQKRAILHSDLQPSQLELIDSTGKKLEPFDERTRMKFDRTIRASMFSSIPPNGEQVMENAAVQSQGGGKYEIRWGPFTYREIPAGVWKASVVFEARVDKATDGRAVNDAWTGKAVSNQVQLTLA